MPGADEAQKGKPLVGRSGKLIDECLAHIGLSRKDVFCVNTVACRPPENRNPTKKEIIACEYFFWRQINTVSPKIIITLGSFAFNAVACRDDINLKDYLGKIIPADEDVVMFPMYHPSYILRSGKKEYYLEQWVKAKEILDNLELKKDV